MIEFGDLTQAKKRVQEQRARIAALEEALRGLTGSPLVWWEGHQCLFCGLSKAAGLHSPECELGRALLTSEDLMEARDSG